MLVISEINIVHKLVKAQRAVRVQSKIASAFEFD
jgi:hypothetical protein